MPLSKARSRTAVRHANEQGLSCMTTPLISVDELVNLLPENPLILDCRFNLLDKNLGEQEYAEGHIPGAFHLHLENDLSGPLSTHGGRHPLPTAEAFTNTLQLLGLNTGRDVVVYDDAHPMYAARAWWLLRYFGHNQVRVLDGGYKAWVAAGEPVDRRQTEKPARGNFLATAGKQPTVDFEQVKRDATGVNLIDSRDPSRYNGVTEPIDPVAGHIPGAVNFPWQSSLDSAGKYKDAARLAEHWTSLNKEKETVVYCGSGVTACANILSLNLAGITATLYPGSWSDWCSYQRLQK